MSFLKRKITWAIKQARQCDTDHLIPGYSYKRTNKITIFIMAEIIVTLNKHEEQSEISKPEENSHVEVFTSNQTVQDAVSEFEEITKSNFIFLKKTGNFGNEEFQVRSKSRIHWESPLVKNNPIIGFSGIPYVVVGSRILGCHLGKDLGLAKKRKYAETRDSKQAEDQPLPKRRRMIQNTKKIGCTAKIHVSHILTFPEFKIAKNTESRKRKASKKLRAALEKGRENVKGVHEYIAKFPIASEHTSHAITGELANIREKVDPRIKNKIRTLYRSGIRKVGDIQLHINNFVAQELFPFSEPPETNRRRFFPRRKDITNLISKFKHEGQSSTFDEENVLELAKLWKEQVPETNLYCRTRERNVSDPTFLFCYQTHWQKKILKTYGNQITLLDATYRMTHYPLPLYFLCVRTNVCYVVVGAFVVQRETTACIQEALGIFQVWNEEWKPKCFLVDFCQAGIDAVSAIFEDTNIFLCDYHRERAWTEWISKKSNGVFGCRQKLLSMLRKMAVAPTEEQYNMALHSFTGSQLWKQNEPLRQWFSCTWLPQVKVWANVYRTQELQFGILTNNGLERLNEALKNSVLERQKNSTLGEMLSALHSTILPNAYNRYVELNLQSSDLYLKHTEEVPVFLRHRPRDFVTHFMKSLSSSLTETDVKILNDTCGIFEVRTESESEKFDIVDFSNAIPSCTCADWEKHFVPCKHMCCLFTFFVEWGWEKVHPDYRNNPLFTLDMECFILEDLQSTASYVTASDWVSTTVPTECVTTELPQPYKRSKITRLRRSCSQKLKRLMDNLYLIKDEQHLEELNTSLDLLLEKTLS